MPLRDFLILFAVCLLWAANTVVSKLVVGEMGVPPLFYAAARTVMVGALLIPLLRPLPPDLPRVLLVTLLIGGGGFALIFLGLRTATASSAAVVILAQTPLTILFAVALLREHVGPQRIAGMLLTLAGVLTVVLDPGSLHASTGLIFVALCAVASALGAVFLKRIDLEPIRLQAWGGVSGAVTLLPLSFALEHDQLALSWRAGWSFLAALTFSAVIVSIVAHTRYFALLQRYDANLIAPLTLMTPILTIAGGAFVTGDPLGWRLILGALLAVAGVLVIVLRPTRAFPKRLLLSGRP